MFHSIYQFVGSLGYHHPLHPMVTHIPVGLTIGALVFALVSIIFRRLQLKLSAWHCALLAIVGVIPTALLGFMDWQEKYHGVWSSQIKVKIALAGVLFVLLLAALLLQRRRTAAADSATTAWRSPRSLASLVLYGVCFLLVVGLGLEGGDLVYGSAPASAAAVSDAAGQAGQKLFADNCASCHPGGGNSVNAKYPLSRAPQAGSAQTFIAFLRDPAARDGSENQMPAFAAADISDQDANALYSYVKKAFVTP
jgi:mono/diheme cytochrome c family protein